MNEQPTYRNMVPLVKVVKAAIVDMYEDMGKTQQLYSHWAARGLSKLQNEGAFNCGRRRALLKVNRNTLTSTLPLDCGGVLFAGYINEDGLKAPVRMKSDLVWAENIQMPEETKCKKCNQNKSICDNLSITQQTNIISINGSLYEETVTKKLYPNGDYYIETETPTLNLETNSVEIEEHKRFVSNIDLKECGCPDDSPENLSVISRYIPEVYATCYNHPICHAPKYNGSIDILEDMGVIVVSPDYPFPYLYIEYRAFMPKVNGQYVVPLVAFETLVNWTKFKSIENKRGVSVTEKQWTFQNYTRERNNMEKVNGKVYLSQIVQAFGLTPKFILSNTNEIRQTVTASCPTKNDSGDSGAVQVIETIVENNSSQTKVAFGKLQFEIGNSNTNPPINVGDTVLTIEETDVIENSVNVMVDSVPLEESDNTQLSYSVVYALNQIVITFNQGATDGQKYKITYAKNITV